MAHILVICTANICRSPVGEALLRRQIASDPESTGWTVGSAGTWALDARPASQFSMDVMAAWGMDITTHRARLVNEELIAGADLVLCMELGHVEALRVEFPRHANRVYLLSEMINRQFTVADPYGGSLGDYERMAVEVERLIQQGWPRIKALAAENASRRDGGSAPSD